MSKKIIIHSFCDDDSILHWVIKYVGEFNLINTKYWDDFNIDRCHKVSGKNTKRRIWVRIFEYDDFIDFVQKNILTFNEYGIDINIKDLNKVDDNLNTLLDIIMT